MIRPVLALLALIAGGMGCAPGHPGTDPRRAPAQAASSLPPAVLDEDPITWEELRPWLAEAAGAAILDEVVLDRLLSREMTRRGLTLSHEDLRREEEDLAEAVGNEAGIPEAEAARMVEALRLQRGLGAARFEALLRRNAMLRALVRGTVNVDETDLSRAYEMQYGPRLNVRVIVVPTERQAAQIRAQLMNGEPHLAMRFAECAARYSTDSSRARGGLLPPLSLADPSLAPAVAHALRGMEPGRMSAPVMVEGGAAILLLEGIVSPPDAPPLKEIADTLRKRVLRARERLAMDDLARRLLRDAALRVHDPSLEASRRVRNPARP